MNRTLLAAVAALALPVGLPALAQTDVAGQVVAGLRAQGFGNIEVDTEDGVVKVEGVRGTTKVEYRYDAETGELLGEEVHRAGAGGDGDDAGDDGDRPDRASDDVSFENGGDHDRGHGNDDDGVDDDNPGRGNGGRDDDSDGDGHSRGRGGDDGNAGDDAAGDGDAGDDDGGRGRGRGRVGDD